MLMWVMIQLVVTSIKDYLRKIKGTEAASIAYPPTEGTAPRHIPEPSVMGQESLRRQSGLEYAPSGSVSDPDPPIPAKLTMYHRSG